MPKFESPKPILASRDNEEAQRQADIEARLRRRRAGASANVLTGPRGIAGGGASQRLGDTA
ncbi:hypothetical protein [Marinovum algicola]|uniref:hypothetical protein n=1 Tax=Marinovum algicola TaxID=42444 RepID=UPI003B528CC2